MAKIYINIEVDTNVENLADVLAGLRASNIGVAGTSAPVAPAQAAASPAEQAPVSAGETNAPRALTDDDIVRFLKSDDRYTVRSRDAVLKHFNELGCSNDSIDEVIEDLLDNGDIETRTRRRDGATMYAIA